MGQRACGAWAPFLCREVLGLEVEAQALAARASRGKDRATLRHGLATHLLLSGVDIRRIQEPLGHAHVAN